MTTKNVANLMPTPEISNVGSALQTSKSKNSSSENFLDIMNNTQVNQNVTTNVEVKSFSSTENYDQYQYKDNSIEKASDNPIAQKAMDNKDEIESALEEIKNVVEEDLEISPEELEDAMETLQLSMIDLLVPENMVALTAEIKDFSDNTLILMDEQYLNLISDVDEIGKELMDYLDVGDNQFAEILSYMDEMDTPMELDVNVGAGGQDGLGAFADILDDQMQSAGSFGAQMGFESEDDSTEGRVDVLPQQNVGEVNQVEVPFVEDVPEQTSSVDIDSVIEQIAARGRVDISDDVTSLEMQLNPANLGRIYLNISEKNGTVSASIAASNEAVKEALEVQLVALRENLNQAGIKVDAVEVTVASHEFERNLEQNFSREEDEGARQEESSRRRNLNVSDLEELSGVMTEEESLVAQMMIDNGNSVDLTA